MRSPVPTDTTFAYRLRKGTATLAWEGGKATLAFTELPPAEREYEGIAALSDGAVLRLERCPAIKLTSDAPLRFGDITLPVANVAPGYPGVYALWLRRAGDGWQLVFNDEADAWGTQHDPKLDRAVVPLQSRTVAGAQGRLTGKLDGGASGAMLSLEWGEHQWSVPFRVEAAGASGGSR
jgi:hypothetical protein